MAACQPTPIYLIPHDQKCGSWLVCDGGLPADAYLPDTPTIENVGAGLPAMAAWQPIPIYLKPHDQKCGSGLAREGGLAGDTVGLGAYPFLR
jgi:hypothetical protein